MIRPEVIRLARLLQIKARKRADQTFSGAYLSAVRGEGIDFKDVRNYVPGDEVRHIDWNVSARTGQMHVKTFYEDRNINLIVALDVSRSMDFGSGERTKAEIALDIVSVLLLAGNLNRHKIMFLAFADDIDLFLEVRSGEAEVLKALTRIIRLEEELRLAGGIAKGASSKAASESAASGSASGSTASRGASESTASGSAPVRSTTPAAARATNFVNLAHFLERVVRKRGVAFILSDFLGQSDPRILAGLRQRFKLNLLYIHDRLEVGPFAPGGRAPILLRDLESGRRALVRPG